MKALSTLQQFSIVLVMLQVIHIVIMISGVLSVCNVTEFEDLSFSSANE